jgi:hypothetical protein
MLGFRVSEVDETFHRQPAEVPKHAIVRPITIGDKRKCRTIAVAPRTRYSPPKNRARKANDTEKRRHGILPRRARYRAFYPRNIGHLVADDKIRAAK